MKLSSLRVGNIKGRLRLALGVLNRSADENIKQRRKRCTSTNISLSAWLEKANWFGVVGPPLETFRVEHRIVIQFDRLIALARGIPKGRKVQDFDVSARVLDYPGLLQGAGDKRHTGAPNAEHFGDILLGKVKLIAAPQVGRPQKPSSQSALKMVRGVAGRRLLGLREQGLLVRADQRENTRVLLSESLEVLEVAG